MSSHDLDERTMSISPVSTPASSISEEAVAPGDAQWSSEGQQYRNHGSVEKTLNALSSGEQSQRPPTFRRKVKRNDDGPLAICCEWIVEHQVGLSVNLLALLTLTHICFPRARRHTRKFFELSYYNAESGEYTAGWDDVWMVLYWIVIFTGLRAATMDYILTPLARRGGISNKKDLTRFAEQAWLFIYYAVFWFLGMYIMYNSDYWLNLRNLWVNWPNREIGGLLKWYTLVQFAFWLQQIMVVNIEKRRKDYWQMFAHHIVTNLLIFSAYGYHQVKVANLVLCIMDVVDLFFPIAKCLKYLGYSRLCDVVFGVFMVTWVIARHIIYMMVCWSVYHDIPQEIEYGCYKGSNANLSGPFPAPDRFAHLLEPFRNPVGMVCWNDTIKWGFLTALLFLQGITLLWFWMICQVAIKVLKGGEADDTRSDDEEVEYEEFDQTICEVAEPMEMVPLEEEVGIEAINLKGRTNSAKRYRKGVSSASGVTLPGHSDRKELLGRIGCDKGI